MSWHVLVFAAKRRIVVESNRMVKFRSYGNTATKCEALLTACSLYR